ncbi:LOW QUALITY PROTEIN: uncharacterized protein PEZ65_016411 [Lycodopsis pacificus]
MSVAVQTVATERRGSVVTAATNRPKVRNAVNQETARRLRGNFCAGYDLREPANHTASLKLEQDVTEGPGPMWIYSTGSRALLKRNSVAVTKELQNYERVPLIDGGTVRLRLIGQSGALDLILTGRPIGAQDALARVAPDGHASQAAMQLAEQISSCPSAVSLLHTLQICHPGKKKRRKRRKQSQRI